MNSTAENIFLKKIIVIVSRLMESVTDRGASSRAPTISAASGQCEMTVL